MMYKVYIFFINLLLCNCYEENSDFFINKLRTRELIPIQEINRQNGFLSDGNYRRIRDIREDIENMDDDSSYRLKAALLRDNRNNIRATDHTLTLDEQEWWNIS